jgi:hypothetical protein
MTGYGRISRRDVLIGGLAAPVLLSSLGRAQGIPEHNAASLHEPPPRPAAGDLATRMPILFDAIVHDDPARADELFLSREAFRLVKGVPDPDPLWERLHRAYVQDIHELHEATADLASASFERFRFTRRRGWVVVGEEANRLPYWAQRHSFIDYRVGSATRQIEVRTMITWDDRWFITHLSEFH